MSTSICAIFRKHDHFFVCVYKGSYHFFVPCCENVCPMMSAKDGPLNFYESAVSFAAGVSISEDGSKHAHHNVPTRSKAGTLFMLPLNKQRDGTSERCVYNSLTETAPGEEPLFTHWFLVTSAEREAYWTARNDVLLKKLKIATESLDNKDHHMPPPCISVVTYERLGVLEWFGEHGPRDTTSTKTTTMDDFLPKRGIVAIDEAHGLLPYLRTQPRLAQTLRTFGRVYHFTYNVRLVDVGYLLRTLSDVQHSTSQLEKEYIKAFPFGDEDAVRARFAKHRHFRTISQLAAKANGKLFDFATTALVLANMARVPGLGKASNKWSDALASKSSRRGWMGRTAKHGSYDSYDAENDEAYRRLVAWKQTHSVRRRTKGRTQRKGRHRQRRGGTCKPYGTSATRRRTRRPQCGGGVDILTCGVGIMLLSVVERFRPGTAQSLGGDIFNLMGKIVGGFFLAMGATIRQLTFGLTPYINTVCRWIAQMNRYLLGHFPRSVFQFRGLAMYAHRAFQFIGRRIYNIPVRYRGYTLLFVGMMGVLLLVKVIVDTLFPDGQYDERKLWERHGDSNICLSTFVFVQDNAKHDSRFHNRSNAKSKHHLLHVKHVHHTLSNEKCKEALQWTMYCRKSHDPERVREGLLIGAEEDARETKLHANVGKHELGHGAKGTTVENRGVVFTHFSDVAKKLCTRADWLHVDKTHLNDPKTIPPTTSVLVLDESTLMKHYQPHSIANIAHIHFYEPTSYSTKESVDSMCDRGDSYKKFKTFSALQVLLDVYNWLNHTRNETLQIGYTKEIPRQLYEYVSRYPRWSPTDIKSTADLVLDKEGLSISHLWHATKTPDELAMQRIVSVQEDVKQIQRALGQYTVLKGMMQRPSDPLDSTRQKWRMCLKNAKKYYEEKLQGILRKFDMTEKDLLAWALVQAEEAKQKALVRRLREEMSKTVFRPSTS